MSPNAYLPCNYGLSVSRKLGYAQNDSVNENSTVSKISLIDVQISGVLL